MSSFSIWQPLRTVIGTRKHSPSLALARNGQHRVQPISGGKADITLASGGHSVNVPMNLLSNTDIIGPGTLTAGNIVNTATLSIQTNVLAANVDGSGTTTVAAGKSFTAARIRQSALIADGSIRILPGRSTTRTSIVGTLDLHAAAQLDLGDNDLIVDYSGASPLMNVRQQILSGVIFSSVAATDLSKGVGYGDTSDLGAGSYSGESLDASAVVIRFTSKGDADLNGIVDSLDFSRFVGGYGINTNALWTQGDFTSDGKVNSLDFNFLAGNFGVLVASPALGAVVPEPVSVGVLAALGLMIRRGRNR